MKVDVLNGTSSLGPMNGYGAMVSGLNGTSQLTPMNGRTRERDRTRGRYVLSNSCMNGALMYDGQCSPSEYKAYLMHYGGGNPEMMCEESLNGVFNGKAKDRRNKRKKNRKDKRAQRRAGRSERKDQRQGNRVERRELRMEKKRTGSSFGDRFLDIGKSFVDGMGDDVEGFANEEMYGQGLDPNEAGGFRGYVEDEMNDFGGDLIQGSVTEWLKDNWYYVAGGGLLLGGGIYLATRKKKKR